MTPMPIMLRQRRPKEPRGITLLLALLFIAAVTAAGIGASTIVITQIQTAAGAEQTIRSFYVSEIGMERSLFTIFNHRQLNSQLSTVKWNIQGNEPAFDPAPGINTALFDSTATINLENSIEYQSDLTIPLIRNGTTVQVDLTQQDNTFSPFANNYAQWLWFESDDLAHPDSPTLEVQWIYIRRDARTTSFVENATIRLVRTATVNTARIYLIDGTVFSDVVLPNPTGVTQPFTAPTDVAGWVVRFTALRGDIRNLHVWAACNGNCGWGDLPDPSRYRIQSNLTVQSRGGVGGSTYTLHASVPWRIPASGLFDYVIFSEATLDKPG